jgi:ATP-dependent RNA helicase DDX55/SPB4
MIDIVLRSFEDFMSIRKIPLKEHPYLTDGGSAPLQQPDERPVDPQVDTSMLQIRKVMLSDRAIHDQVGIHLLPAARD